ncbi:SDR family NAD(P)-dependent oxidoreductase [Paenibacillus sp. FSL R7-0312]|uniref:SDR family NAD(P)-dependent oxidoreductase n=1 Tax=unclassified Paenibacillus TaxID=185978 RepID=UPI0018CEE09B|nr:SDR family NAD(P)-dependent oxidoreductase [Paenibacillus sp. FSL R5-0912]
MNNKRDHSQLETYDFDIYVTNAGIGEAGPVAEILLENVRRIIETNVFSSLEMTQTSIEAKHHPFQKVYPEAAELLVKENERKIWDEKI